MAAGAKAMIARTSVSDYMATELIVLSPEMEINRAMNVLLDARISGAPVIDHKGELIGVLSKKDCLRAALQASYHQELGGTVSDYMSTSVETLSPDLEIAQAAERFIASPYRRFPVIRGGRLVGQISRADVLRALSDQWQ